MKGGAESQIKERKWKLVDFKNDTFLKSLSLRASFVFFLEELINAALKIAVILPRK